MNVRLTSVHRHRRWTDVKLTLIQRTISAGWGRGNVSSFIAFMKPSEGVPGERIHYLTVLVLGGIGPFNARTVYGRQTLTSKVGPFTKRVKYL